MEGDVLSGGSPLFHALLGFAPWRPGRRITLVELVEAGTRSALRRHCGIVQVRPRRSGRTFDVVFLAPELGGGAHAHTLWSRLLTDAGRAIGLRGAERLAAAVPSEETAVLHFFRHLGFTPGITDVVMRREPGARGPAADRAAIDAGPEMTAEVRHFAADADDGAPEAWADYPAGGWVSPQAGLRAGVVRPGGAVEAPWRIFAGANGVWLHLMAPAGVDPTPSVRTAVAECEGIRRNAPIYAAVPDNSVELLAAMRSGGFDGVYRRVHLSKPTAARVIEPVWKLGPAADRALDPAKASPAPRP
jgi:hypothetical protein